MGIFKKNPLYVITAALAPCLFTAAICVLVLSGLDKTEKASEAEALRTLESDLRHAVVTCYSIEGIYPESIAYIEKHYNVRVDKTKYNVFYEIFAGNMLPDIAVIPIPER